MKIKKISLIYTLLVLPFFEPLLFKEKGFERVDKLYTVLKSAIFLYIIFKYFYKYQKKFSLKKDKIIFIILGLEIFSLFVTLIQNGDFIRFIGPAISVVSLVFLTEIYFKDIGIDFIKSNFYILSFLVIINTISIFLYPKGIFINRGGSSIYFLGMDNRFVFFYIPLIFFGLIYSINKYNRITLKVMIVVLFSLISTIYLWSVGAFLGLSIIAFAVIFGNKLKIFNKINIKGVIILILILNIAIVFFQVQQYFSDFITNSLKKDITFSGRTLIWANALKLFKMHPIMGYGLQSSSFFKQYYFGVAHTHNILLNYLVTTGIIGLLLYICIIFSVAGKIKKISNKQIKILFTFVLSAILFLSIGDTLDSGTFFMIYVCMYYYEEVLGDEKNRNSNIL